MFRYTLICVGKMKNRHLAEICNDYLSRLRRQGSFELVELKDSGVESESSRIIEALEKRREARIYVLGEEGKSYSSSTLAGELLDLHGRPAVFVIGSAYGLAETVKKKADVLLALSQFTFTHEIARMLLCEQIYRAVS
ncbi:MAG: 23S rRNA (pseudouridine(1915)-N(3))-methyltransferase RlmH, partial [Verrucomicrobiota bacterium]